MDAFGEGLQIVHSDVKEDNFLFGPKGVCIVDFEHISILPPAFQTYAFFNIGESFARDVGKALKYQRLGPANKLVPVASILQQCGGDANFGLCTSFFICT